MNSFNRQDRFDFFSTFESPAVNLTFRLETPHFLKFCKVHHYAPFHFFLHHVCQALLEVQNFRYRVMDNKVVLMNELTISYTVLNRDQNLNFTHIHFDPNLKQFIEASLRAKAQAEQSIELINTGHKDLAELKKYVFVTSLPWLDLTSVQHPAFSFSSPDIPSLAWGKFIEKSPGKLEMGFSVQGHHGLIDGLHIQLLAEKIVEKLEKTMTSDS